MVMKMSLMGVGGKIALVFIIYFIAAIILDRIFAPIFRITAQNNTTLLIIGIAAAVTGFSLNIIAALGMMKAYRNDTIATGGFYRIFKDPMYVFQIFITLPGLLLLLNSWLALSAVIPAFIAYRIYVREEHAYLLYKFGDKYKEYKNSIIIKFI